MRWWTPDAVAMVMMVGGLVWIVGFYSGRLYERIEWNKLINDGIIPRPRRRH